MTNVKLSDATARSIYPGADANLKKILEESFGASFFSQKITDRIKTFEDACKEIGISPADILHCDDTTDERAYKQLKIIAKALNQGWIPDWNSSTEHKYYPYFNMKNGFVFYDSDYFSRFSIVGSRLCFKSSELARYAGTQFQSIYKDCFTIN